MLVRVPVAFCLLSLTACSSSSGAPDGGSFSGMDSSTGMDVSTTTKSDSSVSKDAGPKMSLDAACGTPLGSDWCQVHAPVQGGTSMVLCDDFDKGVLSSAFPSEGITSANLVNTRYVSAYCSLSAQISPDAGMMGLEQGAFYEHSYNGVPAIGAATLAFDLYLPGVTCEGAVVAFFVALPGTMPTGALEGWLKLSGISSSGYTVTLHMSAGSIDSDAGTATPVSVMVAPSAADKGWARIELDMSTYTLAAAPTPTQGTGTVSWSHIGASTTAAVSAPTTVMGQISAVNSTNIELDVGLLPDPSTTLAVAGCQVFVDDFVTNLPLN